MSSAVLKWIANGTIVSVLVGSVWLAQSARPDRINPAQQVAIAATVGEAAASAVRR